MVSGLDIPICHLPSTAKAPSGPQVVLSCVSKASYPSFAIYKQADIKEIGSYS